MGCLMTETDRDLKGYGRKRPFADWPGGARVAVSFVLNYEEGGLPASPVRSRNVEDLFEYGSRAGFWRVLRLFEERNLHFTSWAIGLALKRNPDAGHAMAEAGEDV